MRPGDLESAERLDDGLRSFHADVRALPGITDPNVRSVLVEQMLESIRRVSYISVMQARDISAKRADPDDTLFDPLKAAVLHYRDGRMDEAYWMVFLFVHFGKNRRSKYQYAREVYGRRGDIGLWDWTNVSTDPVGFCAWLQAYQEQLKLHKEYRGFGNHRKYQSIDAHSPTGTGAAVQSYVDWVAPPRTHDDLVSDACGRANGNPRIAFDILYQEMAVVTSFGRTARFDYWTMVGKLGLAAIEPGSTYMPGATGPIRGARLMFGDQQSAAVIDRWLVELDNQVNVGMQVLEDALCNWEKSPRKFIPFRD